MSIKNTSLKDIDRLFLHDECLKKGIVPIEGMPIDVNRALKDLPAEDARKAKRKFRKLWRKAIKKAKADPKRSYLVKYSEFGKKTPTRRAKQWRKDVVFQEIMNEDVNPKLKKFVYNKPE